MTDVPPTGPDPTPPPVQPGTPAPADTPKTVSPAAEPSATPDAAAADAKQTEPSEAPNDDKKRRFDRPAIGRLLLFATIIIFGWIVISAGRNHDEGSANGYLVWPRGAPAASDTIHVAGEPFQVGDRVWLTVANGGERAAAASSQAGAALRSVRRWHLLLDGLQVATAEGRTPSPGAPSVLSFALPAPTSASGASAAAIAALWSGGFSSSERGIRRVSLSLHADAVGRSPAFDLLRHGPVRLRVFSPIIAIGGLILLAVFVTGIVWLARNTSLLRDGPTVSTPSSLARTQMAFWFAMTIASFCYVWLLTGIWQDVVTANTLVLLGISSTTGLGSTAIASSKTPTSRSFFLDILSEGEPAGVALHRLVMASWTVVLGGVFASTVLWTQRFPTFDPVLLTLMGITSGIYVGFKWLES